MNQYFPGDTENSKPMAYSLTVHESILTSYPYLSTLQYYNNNNSSQLKRVLNLFYCNPYLLYYSIDINVAVYNTFAGVRSLRICKQYTFRFERSVLR